jgi:hypothetical protein
VKNLLATLSFLACLLASCEASAQAPVIGQGGAAPGPALINRGDKIVVGGAPAKVDAGNTFCGTGTAVEGSATAGHIIFGAASDGVNFCRIAFAPPFPTDPIFCIVQYNHPGQGPGPVPATWRFSANLSGISFIGFEASAITVWHCIGTPGP